MQAISLERSSRAQTAVISVTIFGALVLLGLVLAYWTWMWFAPRPVPRVQASVQTSASPQAAYGMFGSVNRDRAPATIAITLLGVVAASGTQSGYAVLRLDAKQTVVMREGEEIEPGVRLAGVFADHIILVRKGTRETLAWPSKSTTAESIAPPINK
jgi:general secretion pathway protein C